LFSLEKFICKIPDYIVCSSKANLKYIIEEMKVSRKKVSELIDGIHEDLFKVAEKDSLRNELKIRAKKIVVYSGSLFESKGINYLINAIPRILKKYQDVEFLIIGYPVEKVKILAKDLKVDEKIIFLDKVDFFQLAKYLSISDVAVDPKVDKAGEGSGKIVNYMGAGLPVVCFDSINNRNFLGETGIYAVSGDSDDLAEKILILLNDKTKCDDFGEKNKRRVSEQFSWNVKGKELYKIYEGLLRN
jgi:glycosyltransferase involved in cell wall biosynthesis